MDSSFSLCAHQAGIFLSYHSFSLSFAALFVFVILTIETFSRRPVVSFCVCLIMNHGTILQQNCKEVST